MQFSSDIKIFPYTEAPEYLLMFSGEKNILLLLRESFYHSLKNGDVSTFDRSCFLMNDMVVDDLDLPFKDILGYDVPEISIPQELQKTVKKQEQFFRDEHPAPDVDELIERIDGIITKFFPDRLKPAGPPAKEKLIASYRNVDRVVNAYVFGRRPGPKEPFVEEAYFTIAAIRHIDDFIDKSLWPNLSSFIPRELNELFFEFLNEWLQTVREFDPEIPDEIIKLGLLELDQVLNCSKENFNRNFRQLFKWKSLDILYVYQRIHGCVTTPAPPDVLYKLALIDYIRDFYKDSIETDTDLSLYKYIRDNRLDSGELVDFLIRLYNREDPVGGRTAEQYLSNPQNPARIEIQKNGIPVFEPFPKIFARAITLLKSLQHSA